MNRLPSDRAANSLNPPAWPGALALAVLYLVSVAWNFQIQQIESPDEPRYVCAARDMIEGTGDWVVPTFNGEPRLKKPVLIYWVLAGFGFLGQKAGLEYGTAFRLMPLCFGLLGVLFTYGLGRRLYGPRVGFLAGALLTTTYYYHTIAREIIIDPMLTAFLLGAWYFFVRGLRQLDAGRSRQAGLPLLAFYVCLGLACLSKGPPLVAIFTVIPMTVYLVWERRRYLETADPAPVSASAALRRDGRSRLGFGRRDGGGTAGEDAGATETSAPVSASAALRRDGRSRLGAWGAFLWRSRVWYGAPLALFIGLFWFYALWRVGEWHAAGLIMEQENLERAMGQVDHNTGIRVYPFLFYVQNVPLHFLPWGLFLLPACWWSVRHRAGLSAESKLLLCGLAIPWCIMGAVGSKRSVYMLPIYPFLALWVALAWERIFLRAEDAAAPEHPRWTRFWKNALGVILVAAPAGAAALASRYFWEAEGGRNLPILPGEYFLAAFAAAGLAVAAGLGLRDLRAGRYYAASLQAILCAGALGLVQEAVIRPAQDRHEDKRAFFAEIERRLGSDRLAWLGGTGNEATWYLRRTIYEVLPGAGLRQHFFENPRPAALVVRQKEFERFAELRASVRTELELSYGGKAYFLVRPNPERPPSKALYERPERPGKERGGKPQTEEIPWDEWAVSFLLVGIFLGLGYHARRSSGPPKG